MIIRKCVCAVVVAAVCATAARGQSKEGPPTSPEEAKVVAVLGGVEYTAADVNRLRASLPEQFKMQTARFTNREFLENYRQMLGLARAGEDAGLADKEPYRTQLEYNRMLFMARVFMQELNFSLKVPSQENLDYYEQHKSDYEEVQVSAIYVDYSDEKPAASDGKKPLSEAEARAKAENLLAQVREGADFAETARQHSDDRASAEKGGDLGYFHRSSALPNSLKRVILALKVGEVSEPLKEGGRYYIFKATDRRVRPYRDVAVEVVTRVRALKVNEEYTRLRTSVPIEYIDEEFLSQTPGLGSQGKKVPLNIRGRREK